MARLIFGSRFPRGPSSVRGAGQDIDGGWSSRREREPGASKFGGVKKSKKAHTGTLAGIGRATGSSHGPVIRYGPGGPLSGSRFPGAVALPKRSGLRSDQDFQFQPAARPSLMTRIGRKIRSTFGRTG
jgi:hypothetical protein